MANEKRLIDANEAIKIIRGQCVAKYPSTFILGLLAAADEIAKLPDVDAVEVVHGRWLIARSHVDAKFKCSECGYSYIDADNNAMPEFNYCPNCGANMKGES